MLGIEMAWYLRDRPPGGWMKSIWHGSDIISIKYVSWDSNQRSSQREQSLLPTRSQFSLNFLCHILGTTSRVFRSWLNWKKCRKGGVSKPVSRRLQCHDALIEKREECNAKRRWVHRTRRTRRTRRKEQVLIDLARFFWL